MIGKRIKEIREKMGVKQSTLCAKVGLSQSYFSQLESGERNIDAADLEKIARALGVGIDLFYAEDVRGTNYGEIAGTIDEGTGTELILFRRNKL